MSTPSKSYFETLSDRAEEDAIAAAGCIKQLCAEGKNMLKRVETDIEQVQQIQDYIDICLQQYERRVTENYKQANKMIVEEAPVLAEELSECAVSAEDIAKAATEIAVDVVTIAAAIAKK